MTKFFIILPVSVFIFFLINNIIASKKDKTTEPKELTSNCCGAKTTEPDSNGLATCLECKEGCVVEDPEEKFLATLSNEPNQ